jgi:hypothetical protein
MEESMRKPLLIALALAIPATALAAPYPYTMSGEKFVKMMSALTSRPNDDEAYMQREKAYGYLDGVRDGSEGTVWCDFNEYKTPDMAYEVADKIAKLPPAERKKNAAPLILQQLQAMYPCRKAGSKS